MPQLRTAVSIPVAATLLLLVTACGPRPQILEPAHESQLAADGVVPVAIDFGTTLSAHAVVRIRLLLGEPGRDKRTVDVTHLFMPAQGHFGGMDGVAGELSPDDGLEPGPGGLVVDVVQKSYREPILRRSVSLFSWEPEIDVASADRCDILDTRLCLLPFPNDHFTIEDPSTDTGIRVHFAPDSTPASNAGVHVDPTEWNRNDGFSPGAMILTHLPDVDLEQTGAPQITDLERSLDPDSPFVVLNAATLERQLHWAELDSRPSDPNERALILRPGKNLSDGETYIVALSNVRDAAGVPIEAHRAFQLYRDGIPTYMPEVESRREHMEAIFQKLEAAGVAREDLFLAWDFTVISKRSLSERMIFMRDDAFGMLGGAAPAFTVDVVDENPSDPDILRRIDGTFQVPLYVDNGGHAPARMPLDADGLPTYQGEEYTARYRCVVPRSASADGGDPVTPARISLYGHGLLGSISETSASHVRTFANEHNIVFCGTDWIGMANDDVVPSILPILADMSLFPRIPDRMHQGFLNTLFLGRLMKHPDGLSSDPAFQAGAAGTPLIDGSDVFYDGNSQGAIAGGAVTAFAQDWTRAVLGVPGMNYSTLLRRSADFDIFLQGLALYYSGELTHSLGIAMIQMLWDRTETSGHANHLTADTYPGTPPKKILLHVAFGDYQVANVSAEVEARSIGASIHQPALAPGLHWEQTPFYGIPAIPTDPFDGSALVYWDSGNPTPPNGNVTPGAIGGGELPCALAHGGDPHECPRRQPAARLQKSEFLRTDGAVVDVCDGAPCLAPDP
jgi:hypothetical protein